MSITASQRRERVMKELFEHRHRMARDLALAVGASEATVRRDLKLLAEEGQLELVYGGAKLCQVSDYSFRFKATQNVQAKQAIGKLAAELVHDEEQLFLDSGTTSFAVAPHLKRRRGLSIIINSTRLALELGSPGLSVILLGGQYRAERMDSVGPLALSALEQLRNYICMIGADGLSMDFGLAAADIESAALYRTAVQNARETILLADHSKFLAPSLYKIVDWSAVSRVVTDRPLQPQWDEFFASRGISVIHGNETPAEPVAALSAT
jgi:DeoR/GlpR family transcriptional regulator of sugar metabolism